MNKKGKVNGRKIRWFNITKYKNKKKSNEDLKRDNLTKTIIILKITKRKYRKNQFYFLKKNLFNIKSIVTQYSKK